MDTESRDASGMEWIQRVECYASGMEWIQRVESRMLVEWNGYRE